MYYHLLSQLSSIEPTKVVSQKGKGKEVNREGKNNIFLELYYPKYANFYSSYRPNNTNTAFRTQYLPRQKSLTTKYYVLNASRQSDSRRINYQNPPCGLAFFNKSADSEWKYVESTKTPWDFNFGNSTRFGVNYRLEVMNPMSFTTKVLQPKQHNF